MNGMHRIEVESCPDSLGRVRDFIETHVRADGFSADRAAELVLAVDEAVSNVIEHGFESAGGKIEVEVVERGDAILVRVIDNAPPFDPTAAIDSNLEMSPLLRDGPGGYGLALVGKLVDQQTYRVTEDGRNELSLVKKRLGR